MGLTAVKNNYEQCSMLFLISSLALVAALAAQGIYVHPGQYQSSPPPSNSGPYVPTRSEITPPPKNPPKTEATKPLPTRYVPQETTRQPKPPGSSQNPPNFVEYDVPQNTGLPPPSGEFTLPPPYGNPQNDAQNPGRTALPPGGGQGWDGTCVCQPPNDVPRITPGIVDEGTKFTRAYEAPTTVPANQYPSTAPRNSPQNPPAYPPTNPPESIDSCADALDNMVKDKKNKKNGDLYKFVFILTIPTLTLLFSFIESIDSCADALDNMVKDKKNKKNGDLYKKASKALKKLRRLTFDRSSLQQLSGNVKRLRNATVVYNNKCKPTSSDIKNYKGLEQDLDSDNDDEWISPKNPKRVAKVQSIIDAACQCIEAYCGAQNYGPPSTPPPSYNPPPPPYKSPPPPSYNPPPPVYNPPPPVYNPPPPVYNPPPPVYNPPPPVYNPPPPVYNPPPPTYRPPPPTYKPPPPSYPSPPDSIDACADALDDMVKDRRNRKNQDIFKKASKALRRLRNLNFNKDALQQLSGNVKRLRNAALDDDNDNHGWSKRRNTKRIAKVKSILDAACECIEDYCGIN
ncbi:unnamed protein product [Nippostrongylus brasiliensis]|uniref:Extensin-like n=1 Tax=Nippostrongylus brasiliensis TaxID=27835 RepID=A0A0N4YQ00_NIPBR|nr:unnamed protein product [Nippostrongylus brasiliensis]